MENAPLLNAVGDGAGQRGGASRGAVAAPGRASRERHTTQKRRDFENNNRLTLKRAAELDVALPTANDAVAASALGVVAAVATG